jgi:2-alkenal reductase
MRQHATMIKWALVSLVLLLVACQGRTAPPPTSAVVSTPVSDLPISNAAQVERLLPTPVSDAVIAEADAEYLLLTNLYERVSPSVVNIEVDVALGGTTTFLDTGRGSGFVFDRSGHIVTNAHVINMAEDIRVTFDDGSVASAEIVGEDLYSDLAVIRVDAPADELVPIDVGDSDRVRVGERAIAIGNPFGLTSSMTVGIVSGLGRQLPSAQLIDASALAGFSNPNIIQVDTDINPGNSGGPLLNSRGELIGVNTAIRSDSGTFEGVGFAVPARTVMRVVPSLIERGEVDYSWIGISTVDESEGYSVAALADELNLPVTAGVLITTVAPDSPAALAGLQGGSRLRDIRNLPVCTGGDIIVAVDGNFVDNMDELVSYLVTDTIPGDTINVMIVRGDQTFEVPVTLDSRPSSSGATVGECGVN